MPIYRLLGALILTAALAMPVHAEDAVDYQLEILRADLRHPWSVAFLPEGGMLVTERGGRLLRLSDDGVKRVEIRNTPSSYVAGQGGYFDVVLHPDFARDPWIYLSYAQGEPESNATQVLRARLRDDALYDSEVIFTVYPRKDTAHHYGGRMAFLPDGTLLITTGDGFYYRNAAQDLDSQLGKTIRLTDSGGIPTDNPFFGGSQTRARIYTRGHRNPQGLAIAADGTIYLHEHGPRGGDEINRLLPGHNYGWPAVTHGVDYTGARVSPFRELPGMIPPEQVWTPSIAPSGLAVYEGDAFPHWRNSLLVGGLVSRDVRRIKLDPDGNHEESLFSELDARIRDVRTGPDGYIYLLTDAAPGKLVRVRPAAH